MTLSQLLARKQQPTTPATTAPVVSYDTDQDAPVRKAWNFTIADWAAMTDQERAFHRWNIAKAPGFSA